MEVEKRSLRRGFLQLFDWNVKSKKKLFSNKSDLPESSKQSKEDVDNLAISQMKSHEKMHGPSLRGADYDLSVSYEGGSETKAPGVVARLMGLDSLPTLDTQEPNSTPFIDFHSFKNAHHPRVTNEFQNEYHSMEYGMRNKLDGFSRNPIEDRLQKLQNRHIERFQSEMLPPKSAKSIPITHHILLSPIKSPGFIYTRNAAYIMEAASKIIEQNPHSALSGRLPTFGSSSIPLRIRDMKERMEATKKTSRDLEASQRPKEPCDTHERGSEVVLLKKGIAESSKNKNKSVSLATQVKVNLQKDGIFPRNDKSIMKQKDFKLTQMDKKQRNTPRNVRNRSTTGRTSEVLRQNDEKQNCAYEKDRSSLKPRVPYQQDRKASSTNGEIKTSKRAVENSSVGSRRVHLATSETGNKLSSSRTKSFSRKKNTVFDETAANNVPIKEKERSVKCNITIDGYSNWDCVDRKNGMDVVSFTFTSPIKKSVPQNEPSALSAAKSRNLCLEIQDDNKSDLGPSDLPPFQMPVIDSDALSDLLEQKLKELSSRVETPQSEPKCQGVEVMESNSRSENDECGVELQIHRPCIQPSLEPSFSDDSCITSDRTTLTSNGSNHCSNVSNFRLGETELQDSASSIPNEQGKFLGTTFEYIKEVLSYADLGLEDFALGTSQKVINVDLIDHLEKNHKTKLDKKTDESFMLQRKVLLDFLTLSIEVRRERASNGSYDEWAKWSMMLNRKELLVDELYKEICGLKSMEELMVDELVDKDMSLGHGKWLDFDAEALEEGVVIENGILTSLIDEMVADFLFS